VISEEFCKQAGKPCQHLIPGGCGIYAARPPVCCDWLCAWRCDGWLGSHPEYRPDRLGVMFSRCKDADGADHLSVWEVTPGALADPRVQYILNRIKGRYKVPRLGARRYLLGVLDNEPCVPEMLANIQGGGMLVHKHTAWRWQPLGDNNFIAVKVEGADATD
jgi:hypothetical protein